jgi:hypothetical protein
MDQPLVSQSVARVKAWLAANDANREEIATTAKVDEKTLRLAKEADWNPTRKTLEKLEALIPADFAPASKRRKVSA